MKNYGANKATEFTKKQIGVIYRAAKNGKIKIEKWAMSEMYDLSDYYGYDNNGSVAEREGMILRILDNLFDGNIETAQEWIDRYNKRIELKSRKEMAKADRNLVA